MSQITKKSIIVFSCLLSLLSTANAAFAADESSSLDSMWIDQEAPTIDTDNGNKGAGSAVASAGVPSTIAPMCSFDEFRQSAFITKGNWPGIGPFKSSNNDISEMTDAKQNHLKICGEEDESTPD